MCFISVETAPKVDANDRYFFEKTFGTVYLSAHLKCTQIKSYLPDTVFPTNIDNGSNEAVKG
jgi:hypothetical protein